MRSVTDRCGTSGAADLLRPVRAGFLRVAPAPFFAVPFVRVAIAAAFPESSSQRNVARVARAHVMRTG